MPSQSHRNLLHPAWCCVSSSTVRLRGRAKRASELGNHKRDRLATARPRRSAARTRRPSERPSLVVSLPKDPQQPGDDQGPGPVSLLPAWAWRGAGDENRTRTISLGMSTAASPDRREGRSPRRSAVPRVTARLSFRPVDRARSGHVRPSPRLVGESLLRRTWLLHAISTATPHGLHLPGSNFPSGRYDVACRRSGGDS